MEVLSALYKMETVFLLADLKLVTPHGVDVQSLNNLFLLRGDPRFRFLPMVLVTDLYDERLFAYNRLHCYSYLEKPLNRSVFLEDVIPYFQHEVRRWQPPDREVFYAFRKRKTVFYVPEYEVVRYERHSHKAYIVTLDNKIDMDIKNLNRLQNLMKSEYFVQCSRSDYVNLNYIREVAMNKVRLRGEYGQVTLSPDRRDDVIGRMDVMVKHKGRKGALILE